MESKYEKTPKNNIVDINDFDLCNYDMTKIYYYAALYCIEKDIRCPAIYLGNIENKCLYCGTADGRKVIALDKNIDVDTQIAALLSSLSKGANETIELSIPKESAMFRNDMSTLYLYAASLAQSLHVSCPLIIEEDEYNKSLSTYAVAINESNSGKCRLIAIRSSWPDNMVQTFISMAHEVRHVWQHSNRQRAQRYFNYYMSPEEVTDRHAYRTQNAEIDANAYAYRVMKDIFGIDIIQKNLLYDDIEAVKMVKAASEKIFPSYCDSLKTLGKCLF